MSSPDTEFIDILGAANVGSDTASPRSTPKALPNLLPILGLADIVIFPGMVCPLLIDSSSSIQLIDDVVAGDRFLGMVLQKEPELENPKPEELYKHGCAGRVLKMLKFPDQTVRVLVEGLRRIRIKSYVAREPYLKARVDLIKDISQKSIELTALNRNAQARFQEIINLSPTLSDAVKIASVNTEDPGKLADLITANLNLSLEERQQLLETRRIKDRLNRLQPLLNRELEVLTLGSKIQKDVASTMSKSQRDYFLREQLRAIQRELGENDPNASEIQSLRQMIDSDGGSIINISSMSAFIANYPQEQVAYQASKGGLEGFKTQLASEWAEFGIRVNNINPGYILTDLVEETIADNPEMGERWKSEMLMDEIASPEEIGPLAVYLASDASSYVTGESIVIDGGYTVR
jgi:Lon protease-like protein/uncharacterized protein YdhG (YjbR/CyaY superfamily)